jgi:NAD(P)-dependent dehydrogenase (short-subunit alcohol dehydrogenase family)
MSDLSGKIAVITGAAGSLGGCMARLMASRGARLVLSDIDEPSLMRCRDEIRDMGGEAISHVADVTDEGALKDLAEAASRAFGGIDVLVNNAGLIGQEHQVELMELDAALWDRTLDVNLKSVFLASKYVLPHLIARGGGAIINISSGSSLAGYLMMNAYASSKGGVNTLTRYIAAQYGKQNVRCNAVLPGIHLSEEALARTPAESLRQLAEHCMLPRIGVPEDVAKVVAFLASDDANFLTAQLIQVDGGLLDHVPHMADVRRSNSLYRSALAKD